MQKRSCILLSSCKRDQENGFNQAVRDTWAKSSPIPVFFIVGDGAFARQSDEVKLNVPDNYLSLPLKTKESLAWAVRQGFTHAFRAFSDTYIDTARLQDDGSWRWDYVGNLCDRELPFMHGGPGYWLGPKAIALLLDSPIDVTRFENDIYEDQWVGRVLNGRVVLRDDKRYSMGMSYKMAEPDCLVDNDVITVHLSMWTNQYDPDWMRQVHAARFGDRHEALVPRDPHQCMCKTCLLIKAKKERLAR